MNGGQIVGLGLIMNATIRGNKKAHPRFALESLTKPSEEVKSEKTVNHKRTNSKN